MYSLKRTSFPSSSTFIYKKVARSLSTMSLPILTVFLLHTKWCHLPASELERRIKKPRTILLIHSWFLTQSGSCHRLRSQMKGLKPNTHLQLDKLFDPQCWTTLVNFWKTKIFFYSRNGLVLFNIEGQKACLIFKCTLKFLCWNVRAKLPSNVLASRFLPKSSTKKKTI